MDMKRMDAIKALYGDRNGEAEKQAARYEKLAAWHKELYGDKGEVLFVSAPGRTEIAGNHTDHNNGRVLAASVTLDTVAAITPNDTNTVTLYSEGFNKPFIVDLNNLEATKAEYETTTSLIRGVAAAMKNNGYKIGGFDAAVTSTVFKGSGLSSSAAFEVMIVCAFDALYNGWVVSPEKAAIMSKYAENVYFGKPSGLLDQMASSVGGLVTMDFKTEDAQIEALSYDFAEKGFAICVVCVGGEHGNLTSEYAAVPAEMKAVAKELGATVLREIPAEDMEKAIPQLKNKVSDRAIMRALHFYDEDARVPGLVEALKRDDVETFLKGIIASGESSWKLLQNLYVPGSSNQEMALALELSRRMLQGKGAWRIHGGGFAGTILAFVPFDMLDAYAERMNSVFGENACNVLGIRPVGGARI
ncbi:MAG: galactokinase [Clostridia bacterium]|nr:galactokinase [Clostridia bacterium]